MSYRIPGKRDLLLVGSSAFALLSCMADEPAPERVAPSRAPIVNGQPDPGHPAVVALTYQGQSFCSGTLVTPTIVVSAAHCIHPDIGVPGTSAQVYFGPDVTQGGTFIDVIEAKYKLDFYLDDPEIDDDISVLRLAEPAPVAPLPMGDTPPAGTQLTLVGFGITSSGGSGGGVKRIATATIDQIWGEVFAMNLTPSGTCNGDSGGTAIWDDNGVEKFVGIHTRSDCTDVMLDERVDIHWDEFVQPFIDQGGGCIHDGACATGCAAPDPDCPCAADGYCTIACVDVATDPDCDPECVEGGACVEGCPIPDPDCSKCVTDGICDLSCASDPDCNTTTTTTTGGMVEEEEEPADEDEPSDTEAEEDDGDGCSVGAPAGRGMNVGLSAMAVAIALGRRRRRR
ncbi:MAG: trypsin-like serine protease [Polyangiaceae bacterium]|nr:trypsin-like serine protease [Polyangiaceae bacterium]